MVAPVDNEAIRNRLRAALRDALRARHKVATSALRSALAAIDKAATTIVAGGNAYPVLPVAHALTGSAFHQAMYVPAGGLAITGGSHAAAASHSHPGTQPAPRRTVTAR
jgi:hypothetical protein